MSNHHKLKLSLWPTLCAIYSIIISAIHCVQAADLSSPATIKGTDAAGITKWLLVDRDPALYTGDFGDCMGGQSLINLTSFDAAYYADNMTVLFNMVGSSNLRNESLMLYISVQAYGEDRFNLVFNPCNANFASVPIFGQALIPVSKSDVADIPAIALNIPDFEGSATLRVFSNSSQTQIACFSAVMRNGASLSHPGIIGSVLGLFTLVGVLASFLTTIHGATIPQIRTHYAHSFSVSLILEAFQSIFLSGALSLDWPSILTAWWSNFAWSCGMIYSPVVIKALNNFVGIYGNSSQVGGAGSTVLNNNGGLQQRIYGRSITFEDAKDIIPESHGPTGALLKRAVIDKNNTRLYAWAGLPVSPGVPLPGNWSSFAGELSLLKIPAADAFLNGIVWLSILFLILVIALVFFKYTLEVLSMCNLVTQDRLTLFRTRWVAFLVRILLRTGFIFFFMIMTLTLYQFSYGGEAGPIAVAAIIFLVTFFGYFTLSFYACYYETQTYHDKINSSDQHHHNSDSQENSLITILRRFSPVTQTKLEETDRIDNISSVPGPQIKDNLQENGFRNIHQDVNYLKQFGWLSARYRLTRWWFFAVWVVYQFVRACLVGGARAHPEAQVFGLFIWELASFICFVIFNPWEGTRNTIFAVWLLGITKVFTSGLSIAFLPRFKVARISATVIGILIIIAQGLLVMALLTLIFLGAISSYISLARDRENFKPESLQGIRLRYYAHVEEKAKDRPSPCLPKLEKPKEPYFSVKNVRREPKIEDETSTSISTTCTPAASILSLVRHDQLYNENNNSSHMINRLSMRLDSSAASIKSQTSRYSTVPFGARTFNSSLGQHEIYELDQNESNSRVSNGQNTSGIGTSSVPLIRASTPVGSLRSVRPSTQQQRQFASQRVNSST